MLRDNLVKLIAREMMMMMRDVEDESNEIKPRRRRDWGCQES